MLHHAPCLCGPRRLRPVTQVADAAARHDPTGTGKGGPGYEFNNENLAGAKYTVGTVAMANAGANTNGSQFFIVYKNSPLAPSYTPFGEVVKGLGIIQNVAKAGSDTANGSGDGHPKEKVVIESVTIKKT